MLVKSCWVELPQGLPAIVLMFLTSFNPEPWAASWAFSSCHDG